MKTERTDELYKVLLTKGYPKELCAEIAYKNLNTDYTATRMLGYLYRYTEPIIRRQMMGRRLEYEVKTSVRLNMSNPQHVKINDVIQNLDPKIFKSKNQFIIDAIQFYIDNYGKETFVIKKKEKERAEYIRSEDIDDIKEEVIEAATNEARKEVIRLLGGVISGMNVGQPVIMQAANSEAQEPTEDVMDDADVAGLAMGWMSKGD